MNFARKFVIYGHLLGSFTCRKGRHTEDFPDSRKIQRLRPGLNPRTRVPVASMLTTRLPKPSLLYSYLKTFVLWIPCRWRQGAETCRKFIHYVRFSAPFQSGFRAHPTSCTLCTGSFEGLKRPGRGVDHPPQSSVEVKERVELFLYSPSGPSWPVLVRTSLYLLQDLQLFRVHLLITVITSVRVILYRHDFSFWKWFQFCNHNHLTILAQDMNIKL